MAVVQSTDNALHSSDIVVQSTVRMKAVLTAYESGINATNTLTLKVNTPVPCFPVPATDFLIT
ncbi:hypothetical protein KKD49_10405 [Myxococcota bacterium]|nr:hypothetical protein [Myxococcota bacterium]